MQLAAMVDTKRFLKVNSIKLKDLEDYFTWHTSLHVHSHMCGIYLPTLEEVEKYNIMGSGWLSSDMAPKHSQRHLMSNILWQLLNDDDLLPTKEVSSLKTMVMADKGCGYTALYSICHICGHPKLQEGECPTDTPKHNATMPFSRYVKLVENHVWAAALVGQTYTQEQCIHLALTNLHPKYKLKFLEEKLCLMNSV